MKRALIILFIGLAAAGIAAGAPEDWGCFWTDPKTLPICLVYIIFDLTLGTLLRGFYAGTSAMILLNPDLAAINPAFQMYMNFLQPFFMLYLVMDAFYLLFMSGSPSGRARAKQMFWKLLLAMIMVSLSPQIFKILLGISHDLAQRILAIASSSIAVSPGLGLILVAGGVSLTLGPAFILFAVFFGFAVFLFLLSVGIRWLGLLILAALFPITIFFYFFEPPIIGGYTKPLADTLMKSTFTFIFAQVLQALMLAISFTALGSIPFDNPAAAMLTIGIAIAGLIMVGAAPLMMMDIMAWLGSAVMSAGMALSLTPGGMIAGAALTGVGGAMMGSGPSALWSAGGTLSMGMARRSSAAALDAHGGGGSAKRAESAKKNAETGGQRASSGFAGIRQDASEMKGAAKQAISGDRRGAMRRAGASLSRLAADVRETGAGIKQAGKGKVEGYQSTMESYEERLTKPIVDRYKAGASLKAQQQQQQNQGNP